MAKMQKPVELLKNTGYETVPQTHWMDTPVDFRPGTWLFPGKAESLVAVDLPNPRKWSPEDSDWKLPPNWKEIILDGMRERLQRYRSFRVFMDSCVRCGACADKCHFYLGSGDPRNMPVLRAELLRSVYLYYFTATGKTLVRMARDIYPHDKLAESFYVEAVAPYDAASVKDKGVKKLLTEGIKDLAPGFVIEAWSWPDCVPEAIRRHPRQGRGYIAATQWHPEFRARSATVLDDTPILNDFLAACQAARSRPRPGPGPLHIRDRASRLLRQALLRRL